MKTGQGKRGRRGFSLIELVIVVVIIGIIGAIAIPRMSRGAAGASDASLRANLAVLRNAIDLYAAEHNGQFPAIVTLNNGSKTEGDPTGNPLLDYTDASGNISGVRIEPFIYGPYLRAIPRLTVSTRKDSTTLFVPLGADEGHWLYEETTGKITANTQEEADSSGKKWRTY